MKLLRKKTGSRRKPELETIDGNVLLREKKDRRSLPDVPDPTGQRSSFDRRGTLTGMDDLDAIVKNRKSGTRFQARFPVEIRYLDAGKKRCRLQGASEDISNTGILIQLETEAQIDALREATDVSLHFRIPAGSMPEGYEMKVNCGARFIRSCTLDGRSCAGFCFSEDLATYAQHHKDRFLYLSSSLMLFFVSLLVVLMRSESVIYFKYNALLYSYSIIAALFLLTRYLYGALYKPVKINPDYRPSVTIVIPCFNEERWIDRTILSCMNQHYPIDKLEVIVVDDCSTDRSVEVIGRPSRIWPPRKISG